MDARSLRDRLVEERDAAHRRLAEFTAVREELAASRGDADSDDEHDPEGSTVAWEGATADAGVEGVRARLAEVETALARLDSGWDGSCVSCGERIPDERLAARPSAQRCVHCAAGRR